MRLFLTIAFMVFSGCSGKQTDGDTVATCLAEYDKRTGQKPVETFGQAKAILKTFKKVSFAQLDPAYVAYEKLDQMAKKYRSKRFYLVTGENQFRYLVGKHRVMDLLPTTGDNIYIKVRNRACVAGKTVPDRVLLLNLQVLKRFFKLRKILKKRGYDHTAFTFTDGFRPPRVNNPEGKEYGAVKSQHLWGKAIDFQIGDIDRNGKEEECVDKKIVVDILDKLVVPDGGLGLYPGDKNEGKSMASHIDVRGKCNRWFNHPAKVFEAQCDFYSRWARPKDPTRARCVGK
jgi:hypothetical protein